MIETLLWNSQRSRKGMRYKYHFIFEFHTVNRQVFFSAVLPGKNLPLEQAYLFLNWLEKGRFQMLTSVRAIVELHFYI